MHDDVWRRAGFAESLARDLRRPGSATTTRSPGSASCSATSSTGTRCSPTTRSGRASRPSRNRDLAARQRRAARRRRAHRALLHRLGHEAGDGGRARAGRLPARAARRADGADGLRGGAAAGGALHPARGAGQPGVVREHRPVRRTRHPEQFAFNIVTRSRRITYDNLRLRDPEFVAGMDRWFAARGWRGSRPSVRPPMFQPFRLGRLELANRVVVSPMDMYSADDGMPTDFHLVHLGARALGGAGLVMTEMVCVSPSGRITPGCAGIYTPEQEAAWARIVDFVHDRSDGEDRPAARALRPQGLDQADVGGHRRAAAGRATGRSSARRRCRTRPANQVPRELSPRRPGRHHAREFVACARGRGPRRVRPARAALRARLPAVVVPLAADQPAHRRATAGRWTNRLRYPLEVFDAVRAAWPADRPMSVRISATDWCEGGTDVDGRRRDRPGVRRARRRRHRRLHRPGGHGRAAGVRAQLPDAVRRPDPQRGRQPLGVAVIAVGAISSYDDVNSILLAGRADLSPSGGRTSTTRTGRCTPRPSRSYAGPGGATWVPQYRAGSRRPPTGRTDGPPPRLQLIREGRQGTRHARWRPLGQGVQ